MVKKKIPTSHSSDLFFNPTITIRPVYIDTSIKEKGDKKKVVKKTGTSRPRLIVDFDDEFKAE